MNMQKNTIKPFLAIVTATASLTCLIGQESDEEVFELSPFSVQSTESSGYAVTDTLAGSRLRADVKDIGAAITIISKDYMDDLGISNIQDLAAFLPSTEPVSTHINPNGGADVFRGNRVNIRGLFNESVARNYFSAPIGEYMPPMDGYNADRVTLSAGANSILFGSANPSGIINTQTAPASLGSDSTYLRHKTDNYGSNRVEFAVNRIIIEDKLAIRVNLLEEEREFFRDPQFLDQHRFYGAIQWKPLENTTIRANMEYVDWERNTAVPTISVDRMGAWRAAGNPTTVVDGATNPSSVDGIRNASGGDTIRLIFGSAGPMDPVQNWKNYAVSDFERGGFTNHANVPLPFDFMDHEQNMGNHRLDDRQFWIGDLTVEQKLGDNLYLQFAAFKQSHQKDIRWSGGNQIWADASSTLPDGSPNPNEGDFFFGGGTVENRDFLYETENYRFTATYDLDLREQSKWAGRHQISLMAQDNTGRRFTDRQRLINTTPLAGFNGNVLNGANRIRPVFYVDIDGGDRAPQAGQSLDVRDWQDYASSFSGVQAEYLNFRSGVDTENKQKVYMLAAQSYFYDDRLVTTLGSRIDTQDIQDVAGPDWAKKSDGSFVSYLDGVNVRTPNLAISNVEESTYSLGGVFHLVRSQGDLDFFSLTYNRSNNFEPSAGDSNYQGIPRDYSTGETIDYGFKASMYQGKLSGKLSWFESGQKNARAVGGTSISGSSNAIWEALADAVDESFRDRFLNGTITDTMDIVTEGLEASVSYRPLPQWRISLLGSRNEAVRDRIQPSARLYMEEHFPTMLQHGDVLVPDRSDRPVSDVVNDMQNAMDFVIAQEGRLQPEMREWKYSILTNYDFQEGGLKGFSAGGYINWQDKSTIGYAFDEIGAVNVDMPFVGDSLLDTGLHFAYKRKIRNEKIDWKIQLNIRNLLDDTDPVAVRADEHPTQNDVAQNWAYRIVEPRSFVLTNTFSW
jgi:iron complex outermembrane receptor protein